MDTCRLVCTKLALLANTFLYPLAYSLTHTYYINSFIHTFSHSKTHHFPTFIPLLFAARRTFARKRAGLYLTWPRARQSRSSPSLTRVCSLNSSNCWAVQSSIFRWFIKNDYCWKENTSRIKIGDRIGRESEIMDGKRYLKKLSVRNLKFVYLILLSTSSLSSFFLTPSSATHCILSNRAFIDFFLSP